MYVHLEVKYVHRMLRHSLLDSPVSQQYSDATKYATVFNQIFAGFM